VDGCEIAALVIYGREVSLASDCCRELGKRPDHTTSFNARMNSSRNDLVVKIYRKNEKLGFMKTIKIKITVKRFAISLGDDPPDL
jgi:hypothetical protein